MTRDFQNTVNEILSDESDVRSASESYQAEFPYELEREFQVTRREFCNFLFLTSSALFLGSAATGAKLLMRSTAEPALVPQKISGAGDLQPGASINFAFPSENDSAILVRAANGNYYAFDQKCTHLTCPVYYSRENDRLECPCHEGGFDVHTGDVLYGPPPRPLPQIEVEERDGEIWAIGIKRKGNGSET